MARCFCDALRTNQPCICDQVVARHPVTGAGLTRRELHAAFALVQPSGQWKGAIDTMVWVDLQQVEVIREAVIFFTGSVPEFEYPRGRSRTGNLRVRAAGYYAAVGA